MGHVLKADRVQFEDPFPLRIDRAAGSQCDGPHRPSVPARIRIAENHPEFAVIEVTCPCGRITHVRCEYAAADVAPSLEEPAPE
jgi:RNase P subunit RPR2